MPSSAPRYFQDSTRKSDFDLRRSSGGGGGLPVFDGGFAAPQRHEARALAPRAAAPPTPPPTPFAPLAPLPLLTPPTSPQPPRPSAPFPAAPLPARPPAQRRVGTKHRPVYPPPDLRGLSPAPYATPHAAPQAAPPVPPRPASASAPVLPVVQQPFASPITAAAPAAPAASSTWTFPTGKHKGKTVHQVHCEDPRYIPYLHGHLERHPKQLSALAGIHDALAPLCDQIEARLDSNDASMMQSLDCLRSFMRMSYDHAVATAEHYGERNLAAAEKNLDATVKTHEATVHWGSKVREDVRGLHRKLAEMKDTDSQRHVQTYAMLSGMEKQLSELRQELRDQREQRADDTKDAKKDNADILLILTSFMQAINDAKADIKGTVRDVSDTLRSMSKDPSSNVATAIDLDKIETWVKDLSSVAQLEAEFTKIQKQYAAIASELNKLVVHADKAPAHPSVHALRVDDVTTKRVTEHNEKLVAKKRELESEINDLKNNHFRAMEELMDSNGNLQIELERAQARLTTDDAEALRVQLADVRVKLKHTEDTLTHVLQGRTAAAHTHTQVVYEMDKVWKGKGTPIPVETTDKLHELICGEEH